MTELQEQAEAAASARSTEVSRTNAAKNGQSYADVLGVKVSAVDMTTALALADDAISRQLCGYVCLTCVHSIMEAQKDPKFLAVLNGAAMALPDGMPMSWVGRLQGHSEMDRVFGPDFMMELCRLSVARGYRHFLYGGQPGVAAQLKVALEANLPGLQIVGTGTPPFRPLTEDEADDLKRRLDACRPDVLWIGISTPKQDRLMARYVHLLQVPLMVGVGAAFDYHTGRTRDCAPWIKRAGLQWFHRLLQEPRRLWRRYLVTNSQFLWKIAWQITAQRLFPRKPRRVVSPGRVKPPSEIQKVLP